MDESEILIGGIKLSSASDQITRLSLLLWGDAGTGKTTLAATAPGKKLILNFDPDGPAAVAGRDDVDVLDLSSKTSSIVGKLKSRDPLRLSKHLDKYDTIIVDSVTMLSELCLEEAVQHYATRKSTMEAPGQHGYVRRNSTLKQIITSLAKITGDHDKHVIFVAHEAAPDRNDDGAVILITTTLGPSNSSAIPIRISETWCMFNKSGKVMIAIKPVAMRRPMKTRMFDTTSDPSFEWKFDPMDMTGQTIEQWWNEWKSGDGGKLKLPK